MIFRSRDVGEVAVGVGRWRETFAPDQTCIRELRRCKTHLLCCTVRERPLQGVPQNIAMTCFKPESFKSEGITQAFSVRYIRACGELQASR
jgi:hypothetical protein